MSRVNLTQKKGVKDTAQHAHAREAKAWLNWLVLEGDLATSPLATVTMPKLAGGSYSGALYARRSTSPTGRLRPENAHRRSQLCRRAGTPYRRSGCADRFAVGQAEGDLSREAEKVAPDGILVWLAS